MMSKCGHDSAQMVYEGEGLDCCVGNGAVCKAEVIKKLIDDKIALKSHYRDENHRFVNRARELKTAYTDINQLRLQLNQTKAQNNLLSAEINHLRETIREMQEQAKTLKDAQPINITTNNYNQYNTTVIATADTKAILREFTKGGLNIFS